MAPIKQETCNYIVDYELLEKCEMKSCSEHLKRGALERNAKVSYLVTLKSI